MQVQQYKLSNYRKIPKISPRGLNFSKALLRGLFLEGLIFGGAYVRREICVGQLVVGRKLPFLLCFTLYQGANSKYKPPGGLYSEGRFNGGFFCVTILGGLYLEGLIHGGAYFRNFTVYLLLERILNLKVRLPCILISFRQYVSM